MNTYKITEILKTNLNNFDKKKYNLVDENLILDNPESINRAILMHPARYAFYAGHYAQAKKQTLDAKNSMEDILNELSLKLRFNEEGKKLTEATIRAKAETDEQYKQLRRIYVYRLEQENILGAMVRSLEHKKDMLVTVASNMRSNIKAGITILEEQIKTN